MYIKINYEFYDLMITNTFIKDFAVNRPELDRDPGAAGIPAGIWRFCPGPGPGRDFVFSRDFSRDFSKIKSVFERKFEPKFHEPVNIFRKVLLQQCSTVLLNS